MRRGGHRGTATVAHALVCAAACTMTNPEFRGEADAIVEESDEQAEADAGEEASSESGSSESDGESTSGSSEGESTSESSDDESTSESSDDESTSESTDDGSSEETGFECVPPLTDCGGDCVDLDGDLEHCGQCFSPCPGACLDGNCILGIPKIVFVTSEFTTGGMGGLEGADQLCQDLADQAGLEGTFLAWLSTEEVGPDERFTPSNGPYVLVDDTLIANGWNDLTDGSLAHAIDLDESGNTPANEQVCAGNEVWTNTAPDGTPLGQDCNGWTAGNGATSFGGRWTQSDGSWTEANCPNMDCGSTLPLYCFQQ